MLVLDADSMQVTRKGDVDLLSLGAYLDPVRRRLFLSRPIPGEVVVLDADSLEIVARLPAPFGVRKLAVNVGQRLLASSSYGTGIVDVWDLDRLEHRLQVRLGPFLRALGTGEGTRAFYAMSRCGVFEITVE